jgi:hypothetical protein
MPVTILRGSFIALLAAELSMCGALADSPVPAAPRQGWAQYHAVTRNDSGSEFIGKMTLKRLNQTTVDKTACLWFESEYVDSEQKRHERTRFLITAEAVQTSSAPFEKMLRILQQNDDAPVTSLPPDSQGWLPVDVLCFPGVLKDAKRVNESRTVKFQRGNLEIPHAYVGTYRWSRKNRDSADAPVYETRYRLWLHPDIPVGYAHAELTLTLLIGDRPARTWKLDYALQDFGDQPEPAIRVEDAPQ